MNLALVTSSKPHKHCMGPMGPCSAWSWVMNLAMVNASKADKYCIQSKITLDRWEVYTPHQSWVL